MYYMTVALQIQKTDEIAMLIAKYKMVIFEIIIFLKSMSTMNKKLVNDIQTIRCISQVL